VIRVYVDAEPAHGPHPGYRGNLGTDICFGAFGLRLDHDVESLMILEPDRNGWPESQWIAVESPILVPWHRVHQIDLAHTPADD
jgi:hypothetical protein